MIFDTLNSNIILLSARTEKTTGRLVMAQETHDHGTVTVRVQTLDPRTGKTTTAHTSKVPEGAPAWLLDFARKECRLAVESINEPLEKRVRIAPLAGRKLAHAA